MMEKPFHRYPSEENMEDQLVQDDQNSEHGGIHREPDQFFLFDDPEHAVKREKDPSCNCKTDLFILERKTPHPNGYGV